MLRNIAILVLLLVVNSYLKADESGYVNITEIGFSSWTNSDAATEHMITVSNASDYQFNPYLSLGAGIGYEHNFRAYDAEDNNAINLQQLPIFADIRVFMDKGQISPFLFLNPGYCLILNGKEVISSFGNGSSSNSETTAEFKDGFYINAGLGIKFHSEGTKSYHLSLGYKYEQQEMIKEWAYNYNDVLKTSKYEEALDKSYFTLKLGYSF